MKSLTLYLRDGCSLCEAMLAELQSLQPGLAFTLDVVEISDNPELEQAYGARVPVLVTPAGELCHYFLDPEKLRCYFAAC